MNELIIRKAKIKDLDVIIDLACQLYETEQAFDNNVKDGFYKSKNGIDELIRDIENNDHIFLVATLHNRVVGFSDGDIIVNKDLFKEKVAYLNRLVVSRDIKCMGVGSKLIDSFIDLIKINGCKFVKLNAFRNNEPAVNLYKKKGFYEYSVFYMKEIN